MSVRKCLVLLRVLRALKGALHRDERPGRSTWMRRLGVAVHGRGWKFY